MRRFSIKQRIFAIGSKFDVINEQGNAEYIVEADKFDFGKNISIYNRENKRVLYLKQIIRLGAHKYVIYDYNNIEIATVQKEFLIPNYNINGFMGDIEMQATDMLGRHYFVTKNNICIGKIDKEIAFFRDEYSLEVLDENYTELLIGLLVIIDMVKYNNENK
jgi:uncharacterized protein YxjI